MCMNPVGNDLLLGKWTECETVFYAGSNHKPLAVYDVFTYTSIAHLSFGLRIAQYKELYFHPLAQMSV